MRLTMCRIICHMGGGGGGGQILINFDRCALLLMRINMATDILFRVIRFKRPRFDCKLKKCPQKLKSNFSKSDRNFVKWDNNI